MIPLTPLLQAFFTDRLMQQRQASSNTIAAYRDTWRLLLKYLQKHLGKAPGEIDLREVDAPRIGAFLNYLETERNNSVRTRNARLAAIHSFFHYVAFEVPEAAAQIQRVLAIPLKRGQRALVTFLDLTETNALLAAPDRATWTGRRDHALLLTAIETGLRVSELISLRIGDVSLGEGPHVRCQGKGRKERCTPIIRPTVAVLKAWCLERNATSSDPLFLSQRGGPLSRDAVERIVRKYATLAQQTCPSLRSRRVTPHALRHSTAMRLLRARVDTSTIALWLGHESPETTHVYLHADMEIKERAIAKTTPSNAPSRRYRPPDKLLAFLEGL